MDTIQIKVSTIEKIIGYLMTMPFKDVNVLLVEIDQQIQTHNRAAQNNQTQKEEQPKQ